MDKFLSNLDSYKTLLDTKIKLGHNIKRYSKYYINNNDTFFLACKFNNVENVKCIFEKKSIWWSYN